MSSYYTKKLNASKLQQCYEIAEPRILQFLKAEIEFVMTHTLKTDHVLDLGCGYGRVAFFLAEKAKKVTGIDVSAENIMLAKEYTQEKDNCEFIKADALNLPFIDSFFDLTICVQNGISAFKVDPKKLLSESIRVTKNGGLILYSSYAEAFWENRLSWFKMQAKHDLVGKLDENLTKNGVIVCEDGFTASTYYPQDFLNLSVNFPVCAEVVEVDKSSLFCKMRVGKEGF